MHILKWFFLFICCVFFLFTTNGPITPEEAFYALKGAVLQSDAEKMSHIISKKSIDRIMILSKEFSTLDIPQAGGIAEAYGINEETLRNITPQKYIEIYLRKTEEAGVLRNTLKGEVLAIRKIGDGIFFKMSNGMDVPFIKEGPYWKFDMSTW